MHTATTTLRSAIVIALAALAAPALGQGQGFNIGTGGVARLWQQNCMLCHGERGRGGGAGTRSLLDEEWTVGGSDRELFQTIKEGIPEMGMEAFGKTLSDEQIWALTVYIRELRALDLRQREGSPEPDGRGVYDSDHHEFKIETVIGGGIDETPWAVEFLPDGRMLLTERPGRLRIHSTGKEGGRLSPPIDGTPRVLNLGQGGLLDVALHPEYADNGWVYLAYSDARTGGGRVAPNMTRIVRGRIKDGRWVDEEAVFEAKGEHYVPSGIHFGCKIVFDPQDSGIMFFGIGERGMGELAQDLTRPNGKIYRIRDDGRVPEDNPFVGRGGAYGQIWSYGHRNPQGLIFDLEGRLWDTEHGPRGGDEVNLIEKGRNYGWPEVSFGINYTGAPLVTPWAEDGKAEDGAEIAMPVYRWMPSIGACGLDVSPGGAFPEWRGDLFAGGLSGENVDRFRMRSGADGVEVAEREEILHGLGRVRDVRFAPDGTLYVVLNGPGKVLRLVPVD